MWHNVITFKKAVNCDETGKKERTETTLEPGL